MAGEEKFGYFHLSEGTEGEDGSLSSGSSWLGALCEWRWKLTTDCFSFVCKKSCKVISCYRRGGRWWRGTEERIKCSEEITHIWSIVDCCCKWTTSITRMCWSCYECVDLVMNVVASEPHSLIAWSYIVWVKFTNRDCVKFTWVFQT